MTDVVEVALRALERAEALLAILNREHTSAELHVAARAVRHEVESARDNLQVFGRDVTAPMSGKVGRNAPETSQSAARAIRTRSGSQRHMLLAELQRYDRTDFELQRRTGIGANSERPRRLELVEAGYVEAARSEAGLLTVREHPDSGLDCQVWRITSKGRAALHRLDSGQMVLAYGDGLRPHEIIGDATALVPEQFVPVR